MFTRKIIPAILLLLGILIYYSPLLYPSRLLGIQDWDQNLAWAEATRLSITKYHQFPFWDPYRCGGTAHFANPQMSVFSLQTLIIVLFGTIAGIKISIVVHGIIGFIGFYLLSRQYSLSKNASIIASIIFSFNGIVGSFLSTGMIVFISFTYSPLILYLYNQAKNKNKLPLAAALIMAISFYSGYHVVLIFLIYLGTYAVVNSITKKDAKHLSFFLSFISLFLIFSLPKLILSLQLISIFPRIIEDTSGFHLLQIPYFLLSPKQNLFRDMDISNYFYAIDENSLYVGVIPLLLFFSFFTNPKQTIKKHLPLLISLICILILMLGNIHSPSPYGIFKLLPLFSSFRVAQRFRFDFIIPFALIAGLGFDRLLYLANTRHIKILIISIALAIYFDMTIFSNRNFFQKTLIINDNYPTNFQQNFYQQTEFSVNNLTYQENRIPKDYEHTPTFSPWSFEYIGTRQNIGTIECYDSITENVSAKGNDEIGYRGEWYLVNGTRIVLLQNWTPNQIIITLRKKNALSTNDTLVLNQNYYPGWFVEKNGYLSPADNYGGLISTNIDDNNQNVTFKFLPYKWLFKYYFRK